MMQKKSDDMDGITFNVVIIYICSISNVLLTLRHIRVLYN